MDSTGSAGAKVPETTDSAAATPAASPEAKQDAVMRTEPLASCVDEMHLPPTRRLANSAGIRLR
jgi:hypothetical protein